MALQGPERGLEGLKVGKGVPLGSPARSHGPVGPFLTASRRTAEDTGNVEYTRR